MGCILSHPREQREEGSFCRPEGCHGRHCDFYHMTFPRFLIELAQSLPIKALSPRVTAAEFQALRQGAL